MSVPHNNIFLVKKHSCFLFNNNANNIIKPKYSGRKNNIFIGYEHKIDDNTYNPLNTSSNNKSLSRTKSSLLSRPYQRQLSKGSFSTKKKLNKDEYNTFKLNGNDFEKDEKTSNIYYKLIKTFYDENGIKLNNQETKTNQINNDFNSKLIKTKKPINKKSLDLIYIGNTNDFHSKKESMNNDYNKYSYQYNNNTNPKITNMNKLKITHKKIIKREKNLIENKTKNDINNMTQMPNSTHELSFNEKFKYIFTNPNISEKSFNLLINQNYNQTLQNYIKNEKEIPKYLEIDKSIKKINKEHNHILFLNKKESGKKKNKYIIIPYINKKINKDNNKNESDDFSYIFHKKNPTDSFDNIKLIKKKLDNKNKSIQNKEYSMISSHYSFNHPEMYFNSCKANNKINNSPTFSFSKNSLNNTSINKSKMEKSNISPKRLEKYFLPNEMKSKGNFVSDKKRHKKPTSEFEIIDINNITFHKSFKSMKKVKTSESKSPNSSKNNNKNKKNKKLEKKINYNYDNKTLLKRNKTNINLIKDITSKSNKANFNKIKNNKNKSKKSSGNINKEKVKRNKSINLIKEQKSNDLIIKNNNQNKSLISFNSVINDNSYINKYIMKEKEKKHFLQRNNPKMKNKKNIKIDGLLSPNNKRNNISYKITITEPSIICNQLQIKNSTKFPIDIKIEQNILNNSKIK